MLLFDFDGVLIDSKHEIAITAYNAATDSSLRSSENLPAGFQEFFLQNLHVSRNGAHMIALAFRCLDAIEEGAENVELQYEDFVIYAEQMLVSRSLTADQFFAARATFSREAENDWIALHNVYQPIWSELQGWGADNVVILTNKNAAAVELLTRTFDLAVPLDNIYGCDGGRTKYDNVQRIHQRFNRLSYTFVEDSVTNLYKVISQSLNLVPIIGKLAAWGLVTPDDIALAHQKGYQVIEQNDLISLISSYQDM